MARGPSCRRDQIGQGVKRKR